MLLWCHRGALPQTHQEMISLIQPGNASCVWWGVCVCVCVCVHMRAGVLARTGNESSGPPYGQGQAGGEVAQLVHPSTELIDLSPRRCRHFTSG